MTISVRSPSRPGSIFAGSPSRSPPAPRSGTRIVTSVPRFEPPEIEKLLERAAISERPSRRLSRLGVGLGPDPDALVADDDREAVRVGLRFDAERPRLPW